jgi:zinc transporter 1
VHSLALVADSFHMLNDVLSLCVGLWAVNVAKTKRRSKSFTYGWQRAETLGALVNGVFLVALCFSIMLEAIQRFFDPPEISNPKWILIIGSAGLAMNILGLFLFHDHGHAHKHESKRDVEYAAEEGHATLADDTGDVLPGNTINAASSPKAAKTKPTSAPRTHLSASVPVNGPHRIRRKPRTSGTWDEVGSHPLSIRNDIIAASKFNEAETETEALLADGADITRETTPLLEHANRRETPRSGTKHDNDHHSSGGHSHSHGDLNIRGLFLHVMGDALGNVGVIATALFIWLTPYPWRFYSDPVVSLFISFIILTSALPLCRAASRILLMATPGSINIDDVKSAVLSLPGVVGCHHIHVWQLSDTTLVSSLHVRVAYDFKREGSGEYMRLAREIRRCLHDYGIHSTTVQPEFCEDGREAGTRREREEPGTEDESCREEDTASESHFLPQRGESSGCLLECGDECARCCETNV